MFSNKITREIISNLKGRISKMLALSKKLSEEERLSLEGAYYTIDDIMLFRYKMPPSKIIHFKELLRGYKEIMKDSKKIYIRKHILPMLNKVVDQEWTNE